MLKEELKKKVTYLMSLDINNYFLISVLLSELIGIINSKIDYNCSAILLKKVEKNEDMQELRSYLFDLILPEKDISRLIEYREVLINELIVVDKIEDNLRTWGGSKKMFIIG